MFTNTGSKLVRLRL